MCFQSVTLMIDDEMMMYSLTLYIHKRGKFIDDVLVVCLFLHLNSVLFINIVGAVVLIIKFCITEG